MSIRPIEDLAWMAVTDPAAPGALRILAERAAHDVGFGPGRSAELFDGAYAEHARRLSRTLRGAVSGAAPVTPPESTEEEQHAGE